MAVRHPRQGLHAAQIGGHCRRETNAGKTAFCLNFAYLNMNQMKVRYLTSEMGCQEIRDRVSKMGEPISAWNPVEFIERANQFADLVLYSKRVEI